MRSRHLLFLLALGLCGCFSDPHAVVRVVYGPPVTESPNGVYVMYTGDATVVQVDMMKEEIEGTGTFPVTHFETSDPSVINVGTAADGLFLLVAGQPGVVSLRAEAGAGYEDHVVIFVEPRPTP